MAVTIPYEQLVAEALDGATSTDRLAAIVAAEPRAAWAALRNPAADVARVEQAILALPRWDRAAALGQPEMPPASLHRLAQAGGEEAHYPIAGAPATGEETLLLLLDVASEPVRMAILYRSPHASAVLERAASDPSPRIRARVAGHAGAPEPLLDRLARDPDPEVRRTVVHHARAPLALLIARADDPSPEVRRAAVACARATDEASGRALGAVLARRADDPEPLVREAVAVHPATPLEARLGLARDAAGRVRLSVARCAATPLPVLEHLARDPDPLVRLAVVAHPRVPARVLDVLAEDASADVREAVADHRETGRGALLRLAADPLASVREVVAMRPSLAPDVARRLRQQEDPVVDQRLRERAAVEVPS